MKLDNKITATQMNRLFLFTREHFVEHYDLQAELADHLANAIEQRWQQNPDLDFEEALQLEFRKFGIFGFSDIIDKRQTALTKKYTKLIWNYAKNFFKLPQIIGTLTAIVIMYWIIKLLPILFYIVLLSSTLFSVTYAIILSIRYRKRVAKTGRKWLLEEIIFTCSNIIPIVYVPMYIDYFTGINGDTTSELLSWLLAVSIILFFICGYVSLYLLPNKAQEHLATFYPEYKLVE